MRRKNQPNRAARVKLPLRLVKQLAVFFNRNGYIRWQDADRVAEEGWRIYKKGDEVRLVAHTTSELFKIRRLLREAGFNPGRPFRKGRQWRQPIYGKREVARFLAMIET